MFYIYRIVCKWAGKSSGDGSAFVLLWQRGNNAERRHIFCRW
jgi:hypothetical protein